MNGSGEDLSHTIDNKIRRGHILIPSSLSRADGQVAMVTPINYFHQLMSF